MSIRKINFTQGEFYHLYNRGNSKQKIFQDKIDYERFIALLFCCNGKNNFHSSSLDKTNKDIYEFDRGEQIVSIGSYVLMPNHFHILITELQEGGISKFMQKLSTAYVMYFNKKYIRTGGLFEGKFKSTHLDTDRYLKYIFSYIHLNPVKLIQKDWKEKGVKDYEKALKYLQDYNYSSYQDYVGVKRIQNNILNKKSFPKYFSSFKSFNTEILEWLTYNNSLGKT